MEAVKAYELGLELRQLRELRRSLELKMKELEHAKSVIASETERKIYGVFSDLLVEITKDEAIEHIERMRLTYKREIERLRKKEKDIMEKLSKLRT